MYSKLFSRILDSSIWLEPDATRLCWLTCLAVMDEDGFVQFASIGNLAHRARVSVEAAQEAGTCLESPDPNSSDPEHEGRRIERVPGGWMVLNANKYAELATRAIAQKQNRERVSLHRARKKARTKKATPCNGPVTVGNGKGSTSNGLVTPLDRDKDKDKDVRTAPTLVGAPPAAAGPPSAQDVVAVWNATVTPPIPKVQTLTADRKRKIAARLKTYPDLETWRTCISWLNGQNWCRASGTGAFGSWTATLDWLIRNDGQIAKQLERIAAEGASRAGPDSPAEPARPSPDAVLTGLRGVLGDEPLRDARASWRGRTLLLGVKDTAALDSQQHAIDTCVLAQSPDAVVEVVQVENVP